MTDGGENCHAAQGCFSSCTCTGTEVDIQALEAYQYPTPDASYGEGTVSFCTNTPPDIGFGLGYELDEPDAGGGCRVPNPLTGACSCPLPLYDSAFPILVDDSEAGVIVSDIHLCGP